MKLCRRKRNPWTTYIQCERLSVMAGPPMDFPGHQVPFRSSGTGGGVEVRTSHQPVRVRRARTCNWVLKDRVGGSPKSCEMEEYAPKTNIHNLNQVPPVTPSNKPI